MVQVGQVGEKGVHFQDEKTEQEMMDFINDYEYETEDTGFCIHPFTFD